MIRHALALTVALTLLGGASLFALQDDGPPITITSPDFGSTFVHAEITHHALIWDKKKKVLEAVVTFIDPRGDNGDGRSNDDTHFFQFPGVTLDEAKGIFSATAANGEVIPVAHYKKALFINSIEVLPNANVRIMYPHGNITVVLEAVSPNDPSMHSPPKDSTANPDGSHDVDPRSLFH